MQQVDVVIIGAGPAGSSAAIALAREGYSVALVDKEQFPREKLCGDFLNPINWPMLRELGVEQEILSRPHEKVTTFRVTSFFGEEAEVPLPGFGLGVRRFDLDHVLAHKAESEGATVLQGCRLNQLEKESRGWFLRCECAGVCQEMRAKILIGADGRNSWVAHHLRLAGASGTRGGTVGFQVHFKRSSGSDAKIEIHLFPGGYAGIVGLGGDTANLCLAIERNRLPDRRSAEFVLQFCLPKNPWLKEILRNERVSEVRSTYPVYFPPRRVHDDGVLLAGDAARVNEPVTGEGIYFAIKTGSFAADTAHQAFLRGDFSAAMLSQYARKCRHAFRFRRGTNTLARLLMYRPAVVSPLISLSAKRPRLLDCVVHAICGAKQPQF
jgi:geranylgeranyl reductase family protein